MSRAASAAASVFPARLIFFCAAGISRVFLAAARIAGSASMTARSSRAVASARPACRAAATAALRAGLSITLVFASTVAM